MIRSRCIPILILTMIPCVFQQIESSPLPPLNDADRSSSCDLNPLPTDIQSTLKRDVGSWKVQTPETLSKSARGTWEARRPQACPGLADGMFDNTEALAYALLLVPVDPSGSGYKLVVFRQKKNQSSYVMTVIEQSKDHSASSYFIRAVSIDSFFNQESKIKFQVQAADGVLMVDSAEKEYEVDLYFWSNGHFRREPVDE